jgi:hypothetical protein
MRLEVSDVPRSQCDHTWFAGIHSKVIHCLLMAAVQGNWIEKLPDHLMKVYGIPKKYFLVKK